MTRARLASALVLPLIGVLLPTVSEEAELVASDGASQDRFGSALALDGDRALVGAELDNVGARTDAGSAYVFERAPAGTWSQVAKLVASDRAAADHLGTAVALDGDRALLGADGDDDQGSFSGSAYVFERGAGGTWSQVAKLLPHDGAAFDIFGDTLSLSGERALVGAPGHAELGAGAGAAYVFERDASGSWVETAELLALDGSSGAAFGSVVVLAGERALVGAFSDDALATDAGAVYVFERVAAAPRRVRATFGAGKQCDVAWRQVAKLTASDVSVGACFGCALALEGNRALIGAFGDDEVATDAGAAYVFERVLGGAWVQRAKLTASAGAASDFGGATVALAGDRALVSAVGADDLGADSGAVLEFVRQLDGTWSEGTRVTASDGGAGHAFGNGLAASGTRGLIGAAGGNGNVTGSGTAYVFALGP